MHGIAGGLAFGDAEGIGAVEDIAGRQRVDGVDRETGLPLPHPVGNPLDPGRTEGDGDHLRSGERRRQRFEIARRLQ